MKLGFTSFACPTWSLSQMIEAATRHGYHGIEFRCDAGHYHGVEPYTESSDWKVIRRQLEQAGLEACCLATNLQLTDDKMLEQLPKYIELAAGIGAPAVRVFAGPMPLGVDLEGTLDIITPRLREAALLAENGQLELWLQTHDSLTKSVDAAEIIQRMNRDNVGVIWDTANPWRMGEEVEQTLSRLKSALRMVHLCDAHRNPNQLEITPLGEGKLPLDQVLTGLAEMSYQGYLCGWWFNDQYGNNPEEALANFHHDVVKLVQNHDIRLG